MFSGILLACLVGLMYRLHSSVSINSLWTILEINMFGIIGYSACITSIVNLKGYQEMELKMAESNETSNIKLVMSMNVAPQE